jgi:hypothetical protein
MVKAPTTKKRKLMLNPSPLIMGIIKLLVEAGNESLINEIKPSVEIESILPIIPIKDISGGIDRTKKKASCPGRIFITGFLVNSLILENSVLIRFKLAPS